MLLLLYGLLKSFYPRSLARFVKRELNVTLLITTYNKKKLRE